MSSQRPTSPGHEAAFSKIILTNSWLQKLRKCFDVSICYFICFALLLYSILLSTSAQKDMEEVRYWANKRRCKSVEGWTLKLDLTCSQETNPASFQDDGCADMHRPRPFCWGRVVFWMLTGLPLSVTGIYRVRGTACKGGEGEGTDLEVLEFKRAAYCEFLNHVSC